SACPAAHRLEGRCDLQAPRGEGVLEAEEVEEGVRAIAITICPGIHRGEEVLEAEEIEEREIAGAIAVGVAGLARRQRTPPPGDVLRLDLARSVEQTADVQAAGVRAGAVLVEDAQRTHLRPGAVAGHTAAN